MSSYESSEEESEDGFQMIRLKPEDFTSGITVAQIIARAERNGEIEHVKGTLTEIPIPVDAKDSLTIQQISDLQTQKVQNE
jgi:hypothetical protein